MPQIQVLDSETINRIAAGEVVERPASVIKELVENAMDAGAGAITVEIKDGGISFMRITDNGCGIEKNQVRNAFMRHATSKIKSAEDLSHIASLGFRGEALSSICAVSQVELITKTADSLTGVHLMMEGEKELVFEEIGAPKGTTFLIRNLFFNTPARKKFLKSPSSECGAITDLMEHLALSRPDIAMKFVVGNQTKFYTSGNGDIREVIYRLYGKDFINNLIEFHTYRDGMEIKGYLGNPSLVRSNRNFEVFFLNGRYIKSTLLAKALEEGYRQYLMQHKFPLCFLDVRMEDLSKVDVNVHPSKMEVRFQEEMQVFSFVSEAVRSKLMHKEMIPAVSFHGEMHTAQKDMGREAALQEEVKIPEPLKEIPKAVTVPEPFEFKRKEELEVKEEFTLTKEKEVIQEFDQMNLFQEKILSTEKRKQICDKSY